VIRVDFGINISNYRVSPNVEPK